MKGYQVIYNSSVATMAGNSGFGVRTATCGTPQEYIEAVNNSSFLRSYSSGKFNIPNLSAVMAASPERIYEYPKTYYFRTLTVKERQVYAVGRVVSTCFDHSFYVTGKASRSGNYVAHIYMFDEFPGKDVFKLLYESPAEGALYFVPRDWTPVQSNEELSALMVGKPQPMPDMPLRFDSAKSQISAGALDLFFSYRAAVCEGKPIVVSLADSETAEVIAGFMSLLPASVVKDTTFVTNHQSEGYCKDVRITFINEYYQYTVYPNLCTWIDFIKENRTVDDFERIWRPVLEKALAAGDNDKAAHIADWIFSRMAEDNVRSSSELNEALFNYSHAPELFTYDTVRNVSGILPVLGKYTASGEITAAYLNGVLKEAVSGARTLDDYAGVADILDKAIREGLDVRAVIEHMKNVFTAFVVSGPQNFLDALNRLKAPALERYTDTGRYPSLSEILPGILNCTSDFKQIQSFVQYLERDPERRVRTYVVLLSNAPGDIEVYSRLFDADRAEADKVDYIGEYRMYCDNPAFAPLFKAQIKLEMKAHKPFDREEEKVRELARKNSNFHKLCLEDRELCTMFYQSAEKYATEHTDAGAVKPIKDFVSCLDIKELSSQWHLLLEVMEARIPESPSAVVPYYNLARKLGRMDAAFKIAPKCIGVLSKESEIRDLVKFLKKHNLMTDTEMLDKARKSRKFVLDYFVAVAHEYNYGYEKVELLVAECVKDSKERKKIMKSQFPEQYKAESKKKLSLFFRSLFSKKDKVAGENDGKENKEGKTRKKKKVKTAGKSAMVAVGLLCCLQGFAADWGADSTACDIRYYVTSGNVRVRSAASAQAKAVRTVKAGDYIYVDKDTLYYNNDEAWVKLSGEEEYILSNLLTIDDNPHYVVKENAAQLKAKSSIFKIGFYNLPKWLVITMFVVWMLLAFALCCFLTRTYIWRKGFWKLMSKFSSYDNLFQYGVSHYMGVRYHPGTTEHLRPPHPEYGYGMRKIVFFDKHPYMLFVNIALIFLLSFVVTIALFVLFGGLTWLCAWTGRVLLIALCWIVIVGGYLGGAVLGLSTFAEDADWRLFRFLGGVACIFLATIALVNRFDVYMWGAIMTDWGTQVFTTFNVFKVSVYIVQTYWLTALAVSAAPLLIFLVLAGLFMIFAGIIRLYELLVMRRYNIKHPCPFCGEPSEPAVYLSHGIPLHVPLRPGIWGMFHITHPATGERMPTLFLNGKDRMERRCGHCDCLISARIGAEKHIAVAGVPNSGKSTLLYRVVSELCRKKIGNQHVCEFTDNLGEDEVTAKGFLSTIADGQRMDIFPEKTAEGRHKSIQMLVHNSLGRLPYRMYINDVAGEMFTASTSRYQDAPFLRNTDVLIFVLDPFTMQAADLDFSPEFASWYSKHVGNKEEKDGRVDMDEAFAALNNTILKYRSSKDLSKIKLMLTFVKTDTGYLEGVDVSDSDAIKNFAISEMGLGRLIYKLESLGFDITYHAVSASEAAGSSGITAFIDKMMENAGISVDKLSQKHLEDVTQRKEKNEKYEQAESERYSKFTLKDPFRKKWYNGIPSVVMSFAIGGLVLFAVLKIVTNVRTANYENVIAELEQAQSSPLYYDDVLDIIKTNVEEKSLSDAAKEDLNNRYMQVDREKRKHLSKLRSTLYANFESASGRMSNFEVSLRYKALDNVREIKTRLDEFAILAPQDQMYLRYRGIYDSLIEKYNVVL